MVAYVQSSYHVLQWDVTKQLNSTVKSNWHASSAHLNPMLVYDKR